MKKYIALNLLLLLCFTALSQIKFLLPVSNAIGKWGYIDGTGKLIIPYQYDLAFNFTEERGMVAVKMNADFKYSFIDIEGNLYGNFNYVEAFPFNNGYALVRFYLDSTTLSWGYIDKSGAISPPISCSDARSFSGGFAAVEKISGWVFVDKKFKEVIRGRYTTVGEFNEGLCAVAYGKDSLQRWGFVNSLGQFVTPSNYISATKFSNHLAAVSLQVEEKAGRTKLKQNKYGYIGGNGDFLIPAKYQEAAPFSEGLGRVKLNNSEFFIDVMGNTVIPLDSGAHASDFHSGFAAVKAADGRSYFIDKNGSITYDFNFVTLTDFVNGYSLFTRRNGIVGYIDTNGNIIWRNK